MLVWVPSVHYKFRREGPERELQLADQLLAIRTHDESSLLDQASILRLSVRSRRLLERLRPITCVPHAGVQVFELIGFSDSVAEVDAVLSGDPSGILRGVNPVLVNPPSREPLVPTGNLFVQFDAGLPDKTCVGILESYNLRVKRTVPVAPRAYFVGAAPDDNVLIAFDIALKLYSESGVEHSYPEWVARREYRAAGPMQWHLQDTVLDNTLIQAHLHAAEAWQEGFRGEGITIAMLDDGFDATHPEFKSFANGMPKVVTPAIVGKWGAKGGQLAGPHGTCCAGIACANGVAQASGVAPMARVMPVSFEQGDLQLCSVMMESAAFDWAVRNGADVISCSWGPKDGIGDLPPHVSKAMDQAVQTGRGGKGCVIVFAVGFQGQSTDQDGFVNYPKVIASGASDGQNFRSQQSNFGAALWCLAPGDVAKTKKGRQYGIWTTDQVGEPGYWGDDYYPLFQGPSASAAGVSGVAALILQAHPEFTWDQVKDHIRRTCDPIGPPRQGEDPYDLTTGHSNHYGYGRVNALRAVR
jgi:hypothetical protein